MDVSTNISSPAKMSVNTTANGEVTETEAETAGENGSGEGNTDISIIEASNGSGALTLGSGVLLLFRVLLKRSNAFAKVCCDHFITEPGHLREAARDYPLLAFASLLWHFETS